MIDVIDRILVSEEEIVRRSKELGKQISEDYRKKGTTPIVIGLLKGSVPFLAEIMKHIDLDIEIDFMDVSSYDGAESVGDVKINKDLDKSVKGESILLVEDIVDTGESIEHLMRSIRGHSPRSVEVATLFFKPGSYSKPIPIKYRALEIGNEFIVGYGLDYDQLGRNLKDVYVVVDE